MAGVKIPIEINGRKTSMWFDSGSPISIFTLGEFRKTLDAAGIKLQVVEPKDQEFRDYGNNPIHLLETMRVELVSNGWVKSASIRVIRATRPSIIECWCEKYAIIRYKPIFLPIQQKGRRVPITLQENAYGEIDKLIKQGHIEKLEDCSDKFFVSPIVFTVKKDGSVKLALDARELNKQVHKNN